MPRHLHIHPESDHIHRNVPSAPYDGPEKTTSDFGMWAPGAQLVLSLRSVTTPPVSTTSYQNTSGLILWCSLTGTLNPTVGAAADIKLEISPDNSAWTTWANPSFPIGAGIVAGGKIQISFTVPVNWYYKATATEATLGALVALG